MKVPPTNTEVRITVAGLKKIALAATPTASTRAANAKVRRIVDRRASHVQNATDGAALRPNRTKT
jgi:hypothetical protein